MLLPSLWLALSACTTQTYPEPEQPSPLVGVENRESWQVNGLKAPAYVVYTAAGVPHVFAENRTDLARTYGFTIARDRFFQLDLVRRLSEGTVSSLLGDLALETDMESRGISMTHATDSLLASFTPEQAEMFTAYAEGFNDYIQAVKDGTLPPPSEYELAAPLLGAATPVELMEPFTLRDIAAIGGTLLFRLGYETEDIGRAADLLRLQEGLYGSEPASPELRQAAAEEVWNLVEPLFAVKSADGWGENGSHRSRPIPTHRPKVERKALDRIRARMDRLQDRFGRDHREGWGSNAWAVAGTHTADGSALLAGDGHLELDIPSLMYQVGLDTDHLGGTGQSQVGLAIAGMPILSVGTNGNVAWSTTQLSGDITDWFTEEITLDANGVPVSSLFQGAQKPLVVTEEVFTVANVPVLGSVGREERWNRYETFDGRWILTIEGDLGDPDAPPAAGSGQALQNFAGDWIVPRDVDGDGKVTAISFDFTGLDGGNLFEQFDQMGLATDVASFHQSTALGNALSQNIVAADKFGDVYYTGYEMVPCRNHLRESGTTGPWAPGRNPTLLIDGTEVGGFTIPIGEDFRAIEGDADPTRCVVPFDEYPHQFTPERGYVLTANNDPAGITFDNDMLNDPYWIGGPWTAGYRAGRIDHLLAETTAGKAATVADMSRIQGDHHSPVGAQFVPALIAAIDLAEAQSASADPLVSSGRLATLWADNEARFAEVRSRLQGWADADYPARSGVETFYSPVETGDHELSVATMIFNTWIGDEVRDTLDDEGIPGSAWQGGGTAGRLKVMVRMLEGRGANNPGQSAGWDADYEEHIFFDVRGTPERETSEEVMLAALVKSLDFLSGPSTGPGEGGFGTDDMDEWVWGLRHQVRFDSLVASYVDDPLLAPLLNSFAITTEQLPLAEGMTPNDPRSKLKWFPRHGDNRNVDAGNPGLSGRNFTYGSGPVMRMVFALNQSGTTGVNIIPGGQSGLVDSEHFTDQAALWLGNQTLPVARTADEVAAAGEYRVSFVPTGWPSP